MVGSVAMLAPDNQCVSELRFLLGYCCLQYVFIVTSMSLSPRFVPTQLAESVPIFRASRMNVGRLDNLVHNVTRRYLVLHKL